MDRADILQKIFQGVKLRSASHFIPRSHGGLVLCGGSGGFRRGEIAKDELGQLFRLPLLPDTEHIVHTQIDLALRVIGEKGIDKPLVKAQLAPIACHLQHIVNSGVNPSVYCLGAVRKLFDQLFLLLGGKGLDRVIFGLRDRKMELIGGLDIGSLPKHGH